MESAALWKIQQSTKIKMKITHRLAAQRKFTVHILVHTFLAFLCMYELIKYDIHMYVHHTPTWLQKLGQGEDGRSNSRMLWSQVLGSRLSACGGKFLGLFVPRESLRQGRNPVAESGRPLSHMHMGQRSRVSSYHFLSF